MLNNKWVRAIVVPFVGFFLGTVLVGIFINNISEDFKPFSLENLQRYFNVATWFYKTHVASRLPWALLGVIILWYTIVQRRRRVKRQRLRISPQIIGRHEEIEQIHHVLGSSNPHCLCIWGLPGTGKTSLLRLTAELAQEAGYYVVGVDRGEFLHVPFTGESFVALLMRAFNVHAEDGEDRTSRLHETLSNTRRRTLLAIDEFPHSDNNFITNFNDYVRHIIALELPILIAVASTSKCKFPLGSQFFYIWDDYGLGGFNQEEVAQFVRRRTPSATTAKIDQIFKLTGGNPKQLDLLLSQPDWVDSALQNHSFVDLEVLDLALQPLQTNQALLEALQEASVLSVLLPEWPRSLGQYTVSDLSKHIEELNTLGYLELSAFGRVKVPEMVRDHLLNQLQDDDVEFLFALLAERLERATSQETGLSKTDVVGLTLEALKRSNQPDLLIKEIDANKDLLLNSELESTVWRMLYEGCEDEIPGLEERANFLVFCGRIADRTSKFEKGRSLYQKAFDLFSSIDKLDALPHVKNKIGESLIATAHFSEAVIVFNEALALIQTAKTQDPDLEFRAYIGLGRGLLGTGNYEQSLASFNSAEPALEKLEKQALFIRYARAKSLVLRDLGLYHEAYQLALRVLRILPELSDRRIKSQAFRTLSASSKMLWKLDNALEYGRLAYEQSEKAFDIRGMGNAYWAIGEAFRMKQAWDDALLALNSGLRWQEQAGDVENVFYSTISKAEVLFKQQRCEDANKEIGRADALSQQLGPYEKLHVRLLAATVKWVDLANDEQLPSGLRSELDAILNDYAQIKIPWAQVYILLILAFETDSRSRLTQLHLIENLSGGQYAPEQQCIERLRANSIHSRTELLKYLNKRY